MKKFTAIMLSLILCLGSLLVMSASQIVDANQVATESQLGNEASSVTFGVLSDPHIELIPSRESIRLKKALNFLTRNKATATFITGDITGKGLTGQYLRYAAITKSITRKSGMPVYACMGNHDGDICMSYFKRYTGNPQNSHYVINGYHFIVVSPDNSNGNKTGSFSNSIDWLKAEIEKAEQDSSSNPIFVFTHQPVTNTVADSDRWRADLNKTDFSAYPNLVMFAGHSHISNKNPASIWQGNFTVINAATLTYYLPDSYSDYLPDNITDNPVRSNFERTDELKNNKQNIAEGLLVSVDGTEVKVQTYDFIAGKYIQEWTFDTSIEPANRPYRIDSRKDKSSVVEYGLGESIKIKNTESDSVEFAFDQAKTAPVESKENIDVYYKVTLSNSEGTNIAEKKVCSDYALSPRKSSLTTSFSSLEPETEYQISIIPVNAYGVPGNKSIETTFTTTAVSQKESKSHCKILDEIISSYSSLSWIKELLLFTNSNN